MPLLRFQHFARAEFFFHLILGIERECLLTLLIFWSCRASTAASWCSCPTHSNTLRGAAVHDAALPFTFLGIERVRLLRWRRGMTMSSSRRRSEFANPRRRRLRLSCDVSIRYDVMPTECALKSSCLSTTWAAAAMCICPNKVGLGGQRDADAVQAQSRCDG